MRIQTRIWEILEPAKPGDRASRTFDIAILALIAANVVAVVLGTVGTVEQHFGRSLYIFEIVSVAIFTVEYASRVWSCVAAVPYQKSLSGRECFDLTRANRAHYTRIRVREQRRIPPARPL